MYWWYFCKGSLVLRLLPEPNIIYSFIFFIWRFQLQKWADCYCEGVFPGLQRWSCSSSLTWAGSLCLSGLPVREKSGAVGISVGIVSRAQHFPVETWRARRQPGDTAALWVTAEKEAARENQELFNLSNFQGSIDLERTGSVTLWRVKDLFLLLRLRLRAMLFYFAIVYRHCCHSRISQILCGDLNPPAGSPWWFAASVISCIRVEKQERWRLQTSYAQICAVGV